MFSGMRKQILLFVFRKKYGKVHIYANISKNNRILQWKTNIVLANSGVFCFDYAWLVPL